MRSTLSIYNPAFSTLCSLNISALYPNPECGIDLESVPHVKAQYSWDEYYIQFLAVEVRLSLLVLSFW